MEPFEQVFSDLQKNNVNYEIISGFDCSHAPDIEIDQVILLKYSEDSISRTVEARLMGILTPKMMKNGSLSVILAGMRY